MNEQAIPDVLNYEQLAQRVQQGCTSSFAELDRRLRPRLSHLLEIRLGNAADAEDVTQQTLLRLFEKIESYDTRRRFGPWVFTIALRLATDHQRQRRGRPVLAEQGLAHVIDRAAGPAERVATREQQQSLWALVGRVLKPDQQTALWLFYGEQLSVAEIAKAIGRTSISVRVLLYRSRKALLPHLERQADAVNGEPVPDGCLGLSDVAVGVKS